MVSIFNFARNQLILYLTIKYSPLQATNLKQTIRDIPWGSINIILVSEFFFTPKETHWDAC